MTLNRTNRGLLALLGLSLLLIIVIAPAQGQNALGQGNVLDRNLNPASGGKNAARIQPNFADRNLIVTDDVAGGRGFRGAVGYSAPQDFRAALGSNDTFQFRADSAYSNPSLFQLGTTFEQLRYGQDLGFLEFRRAGSGDPVTINAQNPIQLSSSYARQRLDRTSMALSTTAAFQGIAEPRVVGLTFGKDNQTLFYSASPLRGLTLEQADQNVSTIGLSIYDAARIRQDVEAGSAPAHLGSPYQIQFKPTEPGEVQPPDPTTTKATLVPISPDYQRLVQRIADRYADRTRKNDETLTPQIKSQVVNRLSEDFQTLTKELITDVQSAQPSGPKQSPQSPESLAGAMSGIQTSAPGAPTPTPGDTKIASTASGAQRSQAAPGMPTTEVPGSVSPAAPGTTAVASNGSPRGTAPGAANRQPTTPDERFPSPASTSGIQKSAPGAPGTTPGTTSGIPGTTPGMKPEEQPAAAAPATLEDFGVVLHHGERIEHLSAGTPDRFNELLSTAELKLREGDYFAAERNFDRALRFTPGHPLATVGEAHAQVGAGLYLSSAFALRNLFSRQPEMIDVTYAPDLLPNRERLDAAVTTLKERLRDETDRDSNGFLLAYIGHQLGDRALVDQGLGAWAQAERGNKLLPLVRSIWLAQPSSQTAPPESPEK